MILSHEVNEINDVLCPDGLRPSQLVFGTLPPTHILHEKSNSEHNQIREAINTERSNDGNENFMVKSKINHTFKHAVSPDAKEHFDSGDLVLVWSENVVSNFIREWLRPFKTGKCLLKKISSGSSAL